MLHKIINTIGTRGISALLTFLITVIISQALGAAGKGEQAILLTTIAFVLIFSDIVSGKTLVYLTPIHAFSALFLPSYLWSLLVGMFAWGILLFLPLEIDRNLLVHVSILAVIASWNGVNIAILMGKEKIKTVNWISLLHPLMMCIVLGVFYVLLRSKTLYPYIFALYVAYIVCWALGLLALRKELRTFSFFQSIQYKPAIKSLFHYGFLNQATYFVSFLNLRLSYYLLEAYFDFQKVGIFSNAIVLTEAIWLISGSVAVVQYARIANTNDGPYAQNITLRLAKACGILSLGALVILSLLPSSVYVLIFRFEDFSALPQIIRLLAPGVLFFSICLIFGHYFSGIGKYHRTLLCASVGLLFTLALSFILIPRMDVYGAAITTSISFMASTITAVIIFFRTSKIPVSKIWITKQDIKEFYADLQGYIKKLRK
ncbi:MAG: polysaccharide biosynthesis C-terminal domain-containing protein [Bacteroidetes bacterium]|nr:polysaccharide biosynthesis C-terminal domain-containing protein [Bacteroidota bacterium]MCL2302478.1 polysaccharide biosynthesis C-terminal domain-containing protein [Lentimicrobiaceae bacterium]